MNAADLDLEWFGARLLQSALTEATAMTYARRAAVFDWAAPRPGDFTGRATREELREATERCQEAAQACRRHASLLRAERASEDVSEDVWDVLREAA